MFIARAGGLVQSAVSRFRDLGARISLADFGTGLASFQHLHDFHVDEIKIDGSVVSELGRTEVADILVEGFIAIARGLGIDVIAEGIETEAQRRHLMRIGCRHGQGIVFGTAQPASQTLALCPQVDCTPPEAGRSTPGGFPRPPPPPGASAPLQLDGLLPGKADQVGEVGLGRVG